MQAHLWHQDNGYSWQRIDEGANASINNGGGSSSGSSARVWGTYQTVGPCKRLVMEYCGNAQYNKRLVTIEGAFDELKKCVDASDHNTDQPNILHLGSLPQTSG